MKLPQNPSRRDVVSSSALAAALAPTVTPSRIASALRTQEDKAKAGRLLMLGGTRFLGPVIVEEALRQGWEVTLFNRGRSAPERFPDLDLRKGDRNTDDYASLAEGEWDLVIDTSCYIPGHVTAAIEALEGRAGHYVLVSTLSVYDEAAKKPGVEVVEGAPVGQVEPEKLPEFKVIQDVGKYGSRYYGALKALCEQAAEAAMPGKVTVVRPGLIVGPDDATDRFTYWPVRVAEGGEVLAPGKPTDQVQYIDVRDLGVWTFDVGKRRVGKVMNANGFTERVTQLEMLESCRVEEEGVPAATFTWVEDEFLLAQDVPPWMGLPLWIPGDRAHYSNALAIKEGLTFRPLKDTAAATLAWHREARKAVHRWRAGIDRAKEADVLKAWAERG